MAERSRYKTKQQERILELLQKNQSKFLTVDQFMECFKEEGASVGRTTVYRMLERMAEEGTVLKLSFDDGQGARYCFTQQEDFNKSAKLVCIGCGSFFPMECSMVNEFYEHIYEEHDFELDRRQMILYGYCKACQKRLPNAKHL